MFMRQETKRTLLSFVETNVGDDRGEAMQAASDATDGSMVSVIGLKSDKVQDICDAAASQSGQPVQVRSTKQGSLCCLCQGVILSGGYVDHAHDEGSSQNLHNTIRNEWWVFTQHTGSFRA